MVAPPPVNFKRPANEGASDEPIKFGAVNDMDVLAVSDDLAQYIGDLPRRGDVRERLEDIANLFREDGDLGMRYRVDATLSASEAFEERKGNCLTYTHLFITIARALDMRVRYQEVMGMQRWDTIGDYLVLNKHIAAYGAFPTSGTFAVDFGEIVPRTRRFGRLISDGNARAQHFNNLGAEALTRDQTELGIASFNRSILIDPSLAYVWTNLGTAYARLARYQEAEWAHTQALRLEPYDISAINQAASLYLRMGRADLAAAYRKRSEKARQRNPYYLFREGVDAIEAGKVEVAVDRLRKATRRQPKEIHFFLQLGKAYAMTGDAIAARDALMKAEELIESDADMLAVSQMVVEVCAEYVLCKDDGFLPTEDVQTVEPSGWPWG
jgi:Flp pilus assembly protein TadD